MVAGKGGIGLETAQGIKGGTSPSHRDNHQGRINRNASKAVHRTSVPLAESGKTHRMDSSSIMAGTIKGGTKKDKNRMREFLL